MKKQQDFTFDDFNTIVYALEQTYGKVWDVATNSNGTIVNGAIWDGKKICLELLRLDYSKSYSEPQNYGVIFGYLHVFDKNLNNQTYSSEF